MPFTRRQPENQIFERKYTDRFKYVTQPDRSGVPFINYSLILLVIRDKGIYKHNKDTVLLLLSTHVCTIRKKHHKLWHFPY